MHLYGGGKRAFIDSTCLVRSASIGSLAVLAAFGAAPAALAQTVSIEDAAARMRQQTITGATIVVHGYQPIPPAGSGDALRSLAVDIYNAIPGAGWLLDYDIVGGVIDGDGGDAVFDGNVAGSGSINLPDEGVSGQSGHLVLLFDWACESNETSKGWGEAAGEALFALLVQLGAADPEEGLGAPLHFIAHSFGAPVASEAVERLGTYGILVDQVTFLDPHDFDQANVPVDEEQQLWTLGRPADYGASVWDNVVQADVYYQTRGHNGGGIPDSIVPNGRPIPGAYNFLLANGIDLPPLGSYGFSDASGDHTYVWDCFYRATVTGTLPPGCPLPAATLPPNYYSTTGWNFSPFAPAPVAMPAPNFYGIGQSHTYSNPLLVNGDGTPNAAGLASLGLTAADVVAGGWGPTWDPMFPANGDFAAGQSVGITVDITPGWSHHGGGGDGEVHGNETNHYLVMDFFDDTRTHNRLYIPADAGRLSYNMWRTESDSDDALRVWIGSTLVATHNMAATDSFYTIQNAIIPLGLRGTVATVSFDLTSTDAFGVGSTVRIDLVHFAPHVPGDVDGDGDVDLTDLALLLSSFGTCDGDPGYLPKADIDQSGCVDLVDLSILLANFGTG